MRFTSDRVAEPQGEADKIDGIARVRQRKR